MKILGIETSCDETSAAIIEAHKNNKTVKLISNATATSLALHKKTGGIIPEIAAREQLKYILPVIDDALRKANIKSIKEIDKLAVTTGPGLIGSLLVGVETAKTISQIYKKPIIPVNHLFGHIYANFISGNNNLPIQFPAIVLVVSGGHTDLLLMTNHKKIEWLGGTRDDAAGEAFDKIARLLTLSYPGGPEIERHAKLGDSKKYNLPRPMIGSGDFDFSFSGLKTAVLKEVKQIEKMGKNTINNLAASTQQTITDVLIKKTLLAARKYKVKSILLSGGVAANQTLRDAFQTQIAKNKLSTKLFVPQKFLCTDNAAMIATAAFFRHKETPWEKITVDPEAYFN